MDQATIELIFFAKVLCVAVVVMFFITFTQTKLTERNSRKKMDQLKRQRGAVYKDYTRGAK